MNSKLTQKKLWESVLSLLPGAAAFFFLTRGGILRPAYTSWLLVNDAATHWLGWMFFRHSDFIQWPLGANPDYGMALGSTIVFTDAIPLMAFLFKPLSPVLPELFQYTGLWILICFLLQSFFSARLLSRFTARRSLVLAGSLFFVISPIFIWRIPGHFSLAAHWLILAGFCLYFSGKFSAWSWTALFLVAALINPYLLVMVMAIWAADLLQRWFLGELTVGRASLWVFLSWSLLLVVMWAIGYFVPGTGFDESGFGYYRMNLLSPIDSDSLWSRLLRDQKGGGGDYEGFNYFGIGMIGLGIVAGFQLLFRPVKITWKRILPLVVVSGCLFLYALSNHVAMGGWEIFSFELPAWTEVLTSTFRVSGRFFWPVYYLLFLLALYILFTRFSFRDAMAICLVAVSLQAIDATPAWSFIRSKFTDPVPWSSPLRSPEWRELAGQYDKLILVPPENAPEDWIAWARFASRHQMATNAGYFARLSPSRIEREKEKLETGLRKGEFDPEALYVFRDQGFWERVSEHVSSPARAGELDGYRVILPGIENCEGCNLEGISWRPAPESP